MQPGGHTRRLLPQTRNLISLSSHRLGLSLRTAKKLQYPVRLSPPRGVPDGVGSGGAHEHGQAGAPARD
jgi:hypothetical protein